MDPHPWVVHPQSGPEEFPLTLTLGPLFLGPKVRHVVRPNESHLFAIERAVALLNVRRQGLSRGGSRRGSQVRGGALT